LAATDTKHLLRRATTNSGIVQLLQVASEKPSVELKFSVN
jgi:hypothetical protein